MARLVCDLPLDKDAVPGRSIAIQNYSFFRLHHFIAGLSAGHRNAFAFPTQPHALRAD
jgi:hypothetical protein